MHFTNNIQIIQSTSLSVLVWANILLITLGCSKFYTHMALESPLTPETGKKLNPKKLQSLSLTAVMDIPITEANKGLVLHELFKNNRFQDRWSTFCSRGGLTKGLVKNALIKLIKDNRDTLGILDDNGYAPIHYAAKNLSLRDPHVIWLFEKLLEYSKDYVNLRSEPRDLEPYNTPLQLAARYNSNPDIIQLLIDKGADVDQENDEHHTPLQLAAMHNHNPEIIKVLIANDADLYQKDLDGDTLVHLAAMYNDNDSSAIIQILAAQGLDVNGENNYGQIPLHLAAKYVNGVITEKLLNLCAHVNKKDNYGNMPLHLAVYPFIGNMHVDNLPIVQLLVNNANVNEKNNNGDTALHLTAMDTSNPKIIQVLVDKGGDANEENNHGQIPLHLAAMHANLVTTKQFSNLCAYVNKKDNDGSTPLHLAVKSIIRNDMNANHLAVVRELLIKGANTSEKNNDGDTPFNIIKNDERAKDLKELLQQYEKKEENKPHKRALEIESDSFSKKQKNDKELKRKEIVEEKSQEGSNDKPDCSKKKRKFNEE